jgi:hypothetical protein
MEGDQRGDSSNKLYRGVGVGSGPSLNKRVSFRLRSAKQVRQLGNIRRDLPRLIARKHAGRRAPAWFFSSRRPFLQYSRPLSDCQPDARPVLDGRDKDFSRLVEVVTGVQQGIDMHTIPAPRFDLVKVAQVGVERIVSQSARLTNRS